MVDRRQMLVATGAALGATSLFGIGKVMGKELGHMSPIGFTVPAGVVDSHCHIFNPEKFAYSPKRKYTPPPATVQDLQRFHAALHVHRTVLVQPSVYGTDNACLVDALGQLGKDARGIAVIDKSFSGQQLDDLAGAGVVGVRINLEVGKDRDFNSAIMRFEQTVETLRGKPLIVQVYAALPVLADLAQRIQIQPHPVVIDHFGLAKAADGPEQAGMSALIGMMQSRKVFVKLSGPYQISLQKPGYADTAAIGSTLVQAAPDQVIWGSDWPHTGGSERPANAKPTDIEAFRSEDEGRNFALVKSWAPQAAQRHKLLVENATSLFGFGSRTA
ncbi:amidohydrolase family protein [Paraburkholderia sp. MPAMCS5]|uniref:amidohydrolase family protein n=1 Tax=Paraburkholderia sp. MPAMCS5 TaxID=3112563 RepID=UPI002E177F30|nr:amidohydrolase family protein [Paraburkholderia sp. MPAMCS5]